MSFFFLFMFSAPALFYTLSLHDALPISALADPAAAGDLPDDLDVAIAHAVQLVVQVEADLADRKSTRLNSSHLGISYAVFCLKKKKRKRKTEALIRPSNQVLLSSLP